MSEILDKRSEQMAGLALDEASRLLREAAGPRLADESIKSVLRRVGRKLVGWSNSRVRAVWYRDPRVRLRSWEAEQLAAIAGGNKEKDKAPADELIELRRRVERLESLLSVVDPTFHGPALAAARHQLLEVDRARGALDRSDH